MKVTTITTCLLALSLSHEVYGNAEYRYGYAVQKTTAAGYIYLEHLLFSNKMKSSIDCLRYCLLNEDCAAFSFTQGQNAGLCRGHTSSVGEGQDMEPRARTRAYFLPSRYQEGDDEGSEAEAVELFSPCQVDEDCRTSEEHSGGWSCFSGQCLCTLSYYHSASRKDCVLECPDSELLDSFLNYEGYELMASEEVPQMFSDSGLISNQCRDLCLSSPGCRFINRIFHENATCTGLGKPNITHGLLDFEQNSSIVFQMRRCE